MNKSILSVLLISIALLLLIGCSGKITDTTGQLRLDVTGLVSLGESAKYEAWIVVDGTPESVGKFTVNSLGHMSVTSFSVEKNLLDVATRCFITIENVPDTSPNQHSNHIILAGDFPNDSTNSAPLRIDHPFALANNFTSVIGKYILSSPTDTNTLNETAGVWFMDIGSGYPAMGLTIPAPPAHWKYEAWAVIDGVTLSMGKFTAGNQVDEGALYSGTNFSPPSYPGEDFLNETALLAAGISTIPVIMCGKIIFITLEPDPDFSSAPFFVTLLKASIPPNAAPHLTFSMTAQDVVSSPIGRAYR